MFSIKFLLQKSCFMTIFHKFKKTASLSLQSFYTFPLNRFKKRRRKMYSTHNPLDCIYIKTLIQFLTWGLTEQAANQYHALQSSGGGLLGIGKITLLVSEKAGWGICFFTPVESVFWLTSAFTLVKIDTRSIPLKRKKYKNIQVTIKNIKIHLQLMSLTI